MCSAIEAKFLANAVIPAAGWPKAAGKARRAYETARDEVTCATRAVSETSTAVVRALEQALGNYGTAEDESTIRAHALQDPRYEQLNALNARPKSGLDDRFPKLATGFIGMEAALPIASNLRVASHAARVMDYWADTVEIFRYQEAAARLRAASAWAGVSALIVAAEMYYVWPNVRSSAPFTDLQEKWDAVAILLSQAVGGDLNGLKHRFPLDQWKGDAASSFQDYITGTFIPLVEELSELADSLGGLFGALAKTVDSFQRHQLLYTLTTTTALLGMSLAVGAAPWFIAAAYSSNTAFNIAMLSRYGDRIADHVNEVTRRARTLGDHCRHLSPQERNVFLGQFTKALAADQGKLPDEPHPKTSP
jgi:hypothetical protein